jgi:hypothetical protein
MYLFINTVVARIIQSFTNMACCRWTGIDSDVKGDMVRIVRDLRNTTSYSFHIIARAQLSQISAQPYVQTIRH